MKVRLSPVLTHARRFLRRWLRHTWISRLPLWGGWRARYGQTRSSVRRSVSFRPALETLEERMVPASTLDGLTPPALLTALTAPPAQGMNAAATLVQERQQQGMTTAVQVESKAGEMLHGLVSTELAALAATPLGLAITRAENQLAPFVQAAHQTIDQLLGALGGQGMPASSSHQPVPLPATPGNILPEPIGGAGLRDQDRIMAEEINQSDPIQTRASPPTANVVSPLTSSPTVQFTSTTYTAAESQGSTFITVTLSQPVMQAVTVSYGLSTPNSGTAISGTDYSLTGNMLTIPAGTLTASFQVNINDDGQTDDSDPTPETVNLSLRSATDGVVLGTNSSTTLTISEGVSPPPPPPAPTVQFSSSTYSANETDGQAVITVTLNQTTTQDVIVPYQTSDGSATAGVDYQASSGSVTIPAGQLSSTFDVTLYDDNTLDEPGPETVNLTLSPPTGGGATLGSLNAATLSIAEPAEPTPSFSAVEQQPFSGVIGSIYDASGTPASVSITWGDGSTTAGTIAPGGESGVYQISGDHTYGEEGSSTVTVTITNTNSTLLTFNATAQIQDAPLSSTPNTPLTAYQGILFNGNLGSFSDAYANAPATDYSITIDWGDKSTPTVESYNTSGGGPISGSHRYMALGNYTVTVTVTDKGGASTIITDAMTVKVHLPYTPGTPSFTEGSASSPQPLATFTEPDGNTSASLYSATIDWGDGSTTDTGTIVYLGNNTFQINGPSHTYAEEGAKTITITLNDNGDGGFESIPVPVTVADAALTDTPVGSLTAFAGIALTSATVASFTDTDPYPAQGDYSASIDWGDGSSGSGTIVAGTGNSWLVQGTHTYTTGGVYTIKTTINDNGASTSAQTSVTVYAVHFSQTTYSADETDGSAPILVTLNLPYSQTVNVHYQTSDGSATAGVDYKATSGTLTFLPGQTSATFAVPLLDDNILDEPTPETVNLTLSQPSNTGLDSPSTAVLNIREDDETTESPPSLTATEGQAFNGVLGAFYNASNPGMYSVSINWGDGLANGSGTLAAGPEPNTFQLSGQHTYTEEGDYKVTVTVYSGPTVLATVTAAMHVYDAALTPTPAGSLTATQGQAFTSSLGSFTDADPGFATGDYLTTIGWGDGSITTGTLSVLSPSGFAVSGNHAYTQTGTYTVTVHVIDKGGQATQWKDTVTVGAPPLPYTAGSPSFVEGAASISQTLATFTDPDGNTDPSQYTATVNWGDNTSTTTPVITALGGNQFQISDSHSYAEDGSLPIQITLTDKADSTSETIPVNAVVTDAPLAATALVLSASAGALYSGPVARFSDANPGSSAGDYSAVINWGDGSRTNVAGGSLRSVTGGGWEVEGGHTYTAAGSYSVSVTIKDVGGATTSTVSTITVGAATQSLVFNTLSFTEGQAFDGALATFTPPAGGGSYTANIGWGDGSQSTGTLTANGSGGFTISGNHTYSEETPSGQPYTLTITVQPAAGSSGTPLSNSISVTVNDAALTPTPLNLTGWANATTGKLVVGKFTDANGSGSASDFTASINWGDGSTATTGTVQVDPSGGFDVLGQHTYTATGTYTVAITVTDKGGSSTVINSTLAISTATASLTATEGQSFSGTLASFNGDVNNVTGVTITWGDGAQTSGTASGNSSSFTVSGTHTYSDEGSYPLSITVQMSAGGPLTASGPATVNDAALTATGVSLSATAGQPLATPPAEVVLATFTDANPSASGSDFTASIDWGDGSTGTGTVQQNGNSWQVLGNHTYANAGSHTATITINDKGGATATAETTINAGLLEGSDYALAVQVAAPAGSGSQASSGTSYTATIDWGDNSTPTTGAVSVVDGSSPLQLLVTGDHVYTEEGPYTIAVTVADPFGNQTTTTTSLTVTDAPLSGYGLNVSGAAGASTGTVTLGGFNDQNLYTGSDYSVSIDWGDGSGTDTTGQVQTLSAGSGQVTGSHMYTAAGSYTVTTTVTDDGGQSTTFTSTATIGAAWSTIASLTGQRGSDPVNSQLVPVGEATVDLNQGGLRLSQVLDFDQSPGTGVGRNPALVYNSVTAQGQPVLQVAVQGDANALAPTQAVVQLTWNGVAQTAHTYSLNQPAGSVYLFSMQPDNPVSSSGAYNWSATVTFTLPDQSTRQATASGTAYVVSRASSPYGAGWGLDGVSQLVIGAAGALRVTGQGDGRFFTSNGNGTYTSPAEDFGTLVQNSDGTYTYTATDQVKYNYNSGGYLTSVVDPHGLATTYQYDTQERLIQVNAIDGGVTTLTYDPSSGLLETIAEPGNRVLSLQHDSSGNLTHLTDVDGTTRTFGYATANNHLLTEDQWSPLDATFTYTSGLLSQVNLGLGSTYAITSAASAGPGATSSDGKVWASITDGDGHETKYQLDARGRLLQLVEPDGTNRYKYELNAAGLPILTVDPLWRHTFDSYNNSGDLTQETQADGSWTKYSYDSTFHQLTGTLNNLGEQMSNSYDPITGDLLTSTDALGATTSYTYYQTNGKSNGLVYSVTTPTEAGTATSYNFYDAARRLVASFDNQGVPTFYGYDASGNPATTTDVYGRVTQTVYSPKNQLVQTIDPTGAVMSQAYNAYGEQTSDTNARGFTETIGYDQRGWVTGRTDYQGVTTEADQHDAAGNLVEQTDANGNSTDNTYNADNELTQTNYADGTSSSAMYDGDGEEISSTDQLGHTSSNLYNLVGEVIASTDPMGRTTRTLYDTVGNALRTTDPMGLSTLNFYNADNEQIATSQQVSAGVWAKSRTLYDLAGEAIGTVDALGHTTGANYNADGEETGGTDAAGHTSTDVYDLVGNLIQSTDARGKVTTFYYDADNRQVGMLDADNNFTLTVYDADGNAVQTIDTKGTTTTSFDADGRAVAVQDADGNVSQTQFDRVGNVIASMDANGKTMLTWYNAMNQPVLSEDPDGNFAQTAYNQGGEAVASSDGAGDVAHEVYNADGEVIGQTDGDGNLTQFVYNADGQQVGEIDPDGNLTQYVLNGLGETVGTINPLGKVTQDVYDLNGQLTVQIDANGRKITYGYDANGNLLNETDYQVDGTVQDAKVFTYDANNNLLTASNGYGTYTMTYDNNGNLLTRTDPFGLTLTYGYDGNGNNTSVSDSLGGQVTKVYDAANRLKSIQFTNGTTQARLDLTYTHDGQVASLTRYKDVAGMQLVGQSVFTYDAAGNTKEIKHTNATGGVLGDYLYSFDTANRLSSETDTENGGPSVTTAYSYDLASQLTQAGASGYAYDSNGNRTMTGYLTGPGNRLLSDGTWNYAYDAVGNTVQKVNIQTGEYWLFTWNDANQLTQASDYDVHGNLIQTVAFKYDAFGSQIKEDVYTASTGQTVVTKYATDAEGNLWADLNASNQLVDRRLFVNINGQTQPFARIDAAGNVAWYLTDHLGSVRLLMDNTGAVIDQIDYDAYGNITIETEPSNGDRYKYASGEWDACLKEYHFGDREEVNGYWLSADSIGLSAGSNPYIYVDNQPTNATDPSGNSLVVANGAEDMWKLLLSEYYHVDTHAYLLPSGSWYIYLPPGQQKNLINITNDQESRLRWRVKLTDALFNKQDAFGRYTPADDTIEAGYPLSDCTLSAEDQKAIGDNNRAAEKDSGVTPKGKLYTVVIIADRAPKGFWEGSFKVKGYHFQIGGTRFAAPEKNDSAVNQVINILQRFPKGSVETLVVAGHGGPCGVETLCKGQSFFNSDMSTDQGRQIAERLSNSSMVIMGGCHCGKDKEKLQELADKLQAKVWGSTECTYGNFSEMGFPETDGSFSWKAAPPKRIDAEIKKVRDDYYYPPWVPRR